MSIEKQMYMKILELMPKLKSRVEGPPKAMIEDLRSKHIENAQKERKDKQRMMNKQGKTKKKTTTK